MVRATSLMASALLAAGLVPAPHASAAPATCQGQVATIIYDHSDDSPTSNQVEGTEGDDVISTTGSVEIQSLGGDDVICMDSGFVDGGDGRDSLQVQRDGERQFLDIRFIEDLDISLGGGEDSVLLYRSEVGTGTLHGGPGADSLIVGSRKTVRADLRQHRLTIDNTGSYDLRGFEDIQAVGRSVVLKGDNRPNVLSGITSSCDITVKGRGGDDDLRVHANGLELFPEGGDCGPRSVRLLGGAGNDYMRGGLASDDKLVGGPGRDTADGRDGTDTCQAEVRHRCEK